MKKTIIFNLEGTVFDSDYFIDIYLFDFLKSLDHSFKKKEYNKIKNKSYEYIYNYLKEIKNIKLSKKQFLKKIDMFLEDIYKLRTKNYTYIKHILNILNSNNYNVFGVFFNSRKYLDLIFNNYKDYKPFFNKIYISKKDSKETYKNIISKNKLKIKNTIIIESNLNNIYNIKNKNKILIYINKTNQNIDFSEFNNTFNSYKSISLDYLDKI